MARPPAKVLRSERLASRRRSVRRDLRRRRRRATLGVTLLVATAIGGWMLSRSSLFALDGIEVAGTRLLSAADVVSASGLRPGQSMLSLDVDAVEARIERLALVRSVTVGRIDPSRVRIVVVEREPAFVIETPEQRMLVDPESAILGAAPFPPPPLPTVLLAGDVAGDAGDRIHSPFVDQALRLWAALPSSLRSGAPVLDTTAGLALVRPEIRIRFGTLDRLEEKLRAVALVLDRARRARERIVALDVRAPSRPAAQVV